MPNKIIKDAAIIDNQWQLIAKEETIPASGHVLLPLETLLAQKEVLLPRINANEVGLWLSNDQYLAEISEPLAQFPVIAIEFPVFMDGRGFSVARLLRERYHYRGEVRAIGGMIRDQLCYLKRCGFNAFELSEEIDLEAALSSLNDFSEAYQNSVDQPTPLFRRRA